MPHHPRWVRKVMAESELEEVARVIAEVETLTSGEIRVYLDARCQDDPMARAVAVFERLSMHQTALRNGVLIYVSAEDHKLAVIGDQGVHERVGQEYWERQIATMTARFREGHLRDGLVTAVRELGAVLAMHFPRGPDDRNELSDAISLG